MKLDLDRKRKYLLAVSGGVDSMVLLHLFQAEGLEFEVLNVDHGTLANASEIIDYLDKSCEVLHVRTIKTRPKSNIEGFYRERRLEFYAEFISQGFTIVTAHHLDDVIEGLLNLRKKRQHFERALQQFTKQQILDYANSHNLRYFPDASNADNKFLRNLWRLDILPNLFKKILNFRKGFAQTLKNLAELLDFINYAKQNAKTQCLSQSLWGYKIQKQSFLALAPLMQKLILKDCFQALNAKKLDFLLSLVQGPPGKLFENKGKFLYVSYDHFLISEFSLGQIQQKLEQRGVVSLRNPKKASRLQKVPFYVRGEKGDLDILDFLDNKLGKSEQIW